MDTKKFEALMASDRMGSFTQAAQLLGCTQSGLTHMMNTLEEEAGFPLLERSHSGTRLSRQGKRLEPMIRRFLEAGTALEQEIEAVRRQEGRHLRVGAYSSMALRWLPAILQRYRELCPNVLVDVRMDGIEELYGMIRADELDLAFVSRQNDLLGDFIPLREDALVAVLPADEESENMTEFPVSGFQGRDFLMPALGFTRDITPMFRRNHVRPRIRNTTVDDSVIISMVEHGLGVSIMSELIMEGRPPTVRALPITPRAVRELGILVRSEKSVRPAVRELIDCAKTVVAGMESRK